MDIKIYMANQFAEYISKALETMESLDACDLFESFVMGFTVLADGDPSQTMIHLKEHIDGLVEDRGWLNEFNNPLTVH